MEKGMRTARPDQLRRYAEQLPVVLSVPNLAKALRETADELDALQEVAAAARQLVRRDLSMEAVAVCEANLLAALAALGEDE